MTFNVLGTGSFLPSRVVTNDDLSAMVDTNDEWIAQRVGVRERHVCTVETATDLAYGAAVAALENGGVAASELDFILCATITPDYASPSVACMVQKRLGGSCPAMDISAACSGFVYALDAAAGYFARGKAKKMLVIGAEQMSRVTDWGDRSTCVIFGDGAGAMVLGEGDGLLAITLSTVGGTDVIRVPVYPGASPFDQKGHEKPFIHMNGQETFKFAVNSFCRDMKTVMAEAGLRHEDVSFIIPHQANQRIIDAAVSRLELPPENFISNIARVGNTSAASVAIAADELWRSGRLKRGDNVILAAFGGGLSSAACALKW